jgi:hypothetical protein
MATSVVGWTQPWESPARTLENAARAPRSVNPDENNIEMTDSPTHSAAGRQNEWGLMITERILTQESQAFSTYSFATTRSERIFEELANGEYGMP